VAQSLASLGIVGAIVYSLAEGSQVAQGQPLLAILAGVGDVVLLPSWYSWLGLRLRTARCCRADRDSYRRRHGGMNQAPFPSQTHLFTVRVWLEDLGAGQREWRGEVHDVVSGERRYFREWPALITSLRALLQTQELGWRQVGPQDESE
jgi:hypothetical protein